MLLLFFKAELKASFKEAPAFPPRFYLSLIIRWRGKEVNKSRRRTVGYPISASPRPPLPSPPPKKKLTQGLVRPVAHPPGICRSRIAFPRLAPCASASPHAGSGSRRFSSPPAISHRLRHGFQLPKVAGHAGILSTLNSS